MDRQGAPHQLRQYAQAWEGKERVPAHGIDMDCHITIVGTCAAGKSTLASGLAAAGYDAHVCAQEHSEIPHLWTLAHPDVLIYLSVDLATLRARRADPSWPETIFQVQLHRLRHALAHCDVYIDTQAHDVMMVRHIAEAGIESARRRLYDSGTRRCL